MENGNIILLKRWIDYIMINGSLIKNNALEVSVPTSDGNQVNISLVPRKIFHNQSMIDIVLMREKTFYWSISIKMDNITFLSYNQDKNNSLVSYLFNTINKIHTPEIWYSVKDFMDYDNEFKEKKHFLWGNVAPHTGTDW